MMTHVYPCQTTGGTWLTIQFQQPHARLLYLV